LGIVLAAAGLGLPRAARAAEVPTAWWMTELRRELSGNDRVRIVHETGRKLTADPEVDSTGVRPANAELIEWETIEHIDVGHNGSLRGAMIGALLGVTAGLIYYTSVDAPEDEDSPGTIPILMGTGAVLGYAIGTPVTVWKTIYPSTLKPTGRPVRS
jgi:hypothetical protein